MADLTFLVQHTMLFSIPLLVVALAAMFSEHSGVINIGLEGTMVIGAFFSTLYIYMMNQQESFHSGQVLFFAILIAALTGMLYSAFHAFACVNMLSDQTISGTALNLFATAFSIYMARSIIGVQQVSFTGDFRIDKIPLFGDIPIIGPMLFQNTYITTFLGILILLISHFVLYKTRFGLRLRSAGEFPQATDAASVSVTKIRWAGVLISGLLAGFGGLAYILPITTEFNGNVSGYGFLAIAVLIFGQWKPKKIAFAAFFFGFLKAVSSSYSGIAFFYNLGIPRVIYQILPYLITILVLFLASDQSHAPSAEGQAFDQGKR